jgi:GDP-4-dehydro-6-deoxy-D-mannose reductase
VRDPEAVAALLRRLAPERLVHLAGASSVGGSFADPLGTWEINLGGTLAVLEGLRQAAPETRALVVTSGEIYGRVEPEALPVVADTPLRPLSPYGASKAAADLAAGQYRAAHGLPLLRVRAFNHVGPGQDPRFVLPNVARQIARAERDGRAGIEVRVGNVETRRDFTDVRDMVRAYWLLLEKGTPGEVYNIGSGNTRTMQDVLNKLLSLSKVSVEVRVDPTRLRPSDVMILWADASKFMEATGWKPTIPYDRTLSDLLDYWRERV